MTAELEGKFLVSTRREPAFISLEFSNWKVATTAFRKHQASECHKEATEALVALPKQVCDVGELLSVAHREEKAVNRRMLIKIICTIKFLAHQGLPLRGVGADADSNLVQLLQLQSRDCPELCTWLQKKTNKYTSHDIQNEIMSIMAMQILRKVCQEIRENGPYTIMADECTDAANRAIYALYSVSKRRSELL